MALTKGRRHISKLEEGNEARCRNKKNRSKVGQGLLPTIDASIISKTITDPRETPSCSLETVSSSTETVSSTTETVSGSSDGDGNWTKLVAVPDSTESVLDSGPDTTNTVPELYNAVDEAIDNIGDIPDGLHESCVSVTSPDLCLHWRQFCLLSCLFSGLALPRLMLRSLPWKLQAKLTTGAEWTQGRTLVVNNWERLQYRYLGILSSSNKDRGKDPRTIFLQYEKLGVLTRQARNRWLIDEQVFSLFRERLRVTVSRMNQLLSDGLAGEGQYFQMDFSIRLSDDYSQKTEEKIQCLKLLKDRGILYWPQQEDQVTESEDWISELGMENDFYDEGHSDEVMESIGESITIREEMDLEYLVDLEDKYLKNEIRTVISDNDQLSDEEEVLAEFLLEESRLNMEIDEMLTEEEDIVFKFCIVDDGPDKDDSFFKLDHLLLDEDKEREKINKFEDYGESICTDESNDLQHLLNLVELETVKKELVEADRNTNGCLVAKDINNSEINLDKLKFESRTGRVFHELGEEDESGRQIVRVPDNARILHVPDNVKVVREPQRKDKTAYSRGHTNNTSSKSIRNSNKFGTKLKSRQKRTRRASSPEVEILEASTNSSIRLNNLAGIARPRCLNQRPGLKISAVQKPSSATLSVSTSNPKNRNDGRLLSSKSGRLPDNIRSSNNRFVQLNRPRFGKDINSSRTNEVNIGGSRKSFITDKQHRNSVGFSNDKNVSPSSFHGNNDTYRAPSHLNRMTGTDSNESRNKQNRVLTENNIRTDTVINADGRREARYSCTYCPFGNYIRKEVLKHIGSFHRDRGV